MVNQPYNLNPQQQNHALDRANAALSLVEQIEILIRDVHLFAQALSDQHERSECESFSGRLKTLYQMLNNDGELLFDVTGTNRSLKEAYPTKIERLGLSKEIIRLREENRLSIADIANKYGLSNLTVSKFLQTYDSAKPIDKVKMKSTSIFSITEQIESLAAGIYRQMSRLEGSNDEVHVKYVAELRQTIAMADKYLDKASAISEANAKVEQIRAVIMETLMEELPDKRTAIIKRFEALKLMGTLKSA
jgi:transcriptional regulator with XRE-family HTH domain